MWGEGDSRQSERTMKQLLLIRFLMIITSI